MLRIFVLVVMMTVGLTAQEQFEVASVKPSTLPGSGWGFTPSGFHANTEVYWVIAAAFEVPVGLAGVKIVYPRRIEPVLFARFEIEARGEGNRPAMLRELLRERFGLRAGWETRQIPVFALRVKTPGKLKSSTINCNALRKPGIAFPPECVGGRFAGSVTEILNRDLAIVDARPVVDQTGLVGNFDWTLHVAAATEANRDDREDRVNRLRDAMEEQLGLTLTRITGPYDVLVIDALHEPTPN